jgi:uncharacterized phage protein (TIGR01671 family)
MRTIKFRGKHDLTDEWKYGNLECTEDGEHAVIRTYERETYRVHPDTVGQFTGLYDVDGNEIYEGDIIESSQRIRHQIVYDSDLSAFKAKGLNNWAYCSVDKDWLAAFQKKVVGSIHDNSKLLSKTK